MKFHQNFNRLAIRPYSRGYNAPSTALYNTDLGSIQISPSKENTEPVERINLPDFIEILVDFVPIPLPRENLMATFQFNTVTWPSVPLYPEDEPEFVSALKLIFGGVIRIRDGTEKESILIRGNIIEGFEIDVKDDKPIYVYKFEYCEHSIEYIVQGKRTLIPIWPAGGFYRPGCDIEQIQQVFCALSDLEGKTFARKSLLTQWNAQGHHPPLAFENDGHKTVFQTNRQDFYTRFVDDIRKGVATIQLIDPRAEEKSVYFNYKSIDIKPYGIGKAFLHFIKV